MIPHEKFVLAGKATFTLQHVPSDKHYTFRVNTPASFDPVRNPIWFVNLGIDYESSVYMGMLKAYNNQEPGELPPFSLTKGSRVSDTAPSAVMFRNWWGAIRQGHNPEETVQIKFRHEGKCCMCSRPLTNPESIDKGIGPECEGKLV